MPDIHWKDDPDDHDYDAALDYLTLLDEQSVAESYVRLLRKARPEQRKAKDILRASQLPLLDRDNAHVWKDIKRIRADEPISPVLLLRGSPLTIADGYHRVCAVYHTDEDAEIACRIV